METKFCFNWQAIVRQAVKIRKEQRLTQKELSVIAGVSKPTLNDFEQGRTSITVASMMKILHVIGVLDHAEQQEKSEKT